MSGPLPPSRDTIMGYMADGTPVRYADRPAAFWADPPSAQADDDIEGWEADGTPVRRGVPRTAAKTQAAWWEAAPLVEQPRDGQQPETPPAAWWEAAPLVAQSGDGQPPAAPRAAPQDARAAQYRRALDAVSPADAGLPVVGRWANNLLDSVPFSKDSSAAGAATGIWLGDQINQGVDNLAQNDRGWVGNLARAMATRREEQARAHPERETPDGSWVDHYRGLKGALDDRQAEYFQDKPVEAFSSALMAPIGSIGRLAELRLLKPAAQSAPAVQRALVGTANAATSGAAVGAALGATSGEGDLASMEGLQERADSALWGAGAGAVLGPVLSAGAKVAEPVLGPALRGAFDLLGDNGQRAATRKLAELMDEAHVTPSQAISTMAAGARVEKPVAVVDTLGATGAEATAGMVHAGGPGRQVMTDFLHTRDMGAPAVAAEVAPTQVRPDSTRSAQRTVLETQIRQVEDELMTVASPIRRSIDKEGDQQTIALLRGRLSDLEEALAHLDMEDGAAGAVRTMQRTPAQAKEWSMLREGGSADRIVTDLGDTLSRDGKFQSRDAVTRAKAQSAANDYARFEMERPFNFENHNELAVDFYDLLVPTPALQEAVKRAATSARNRSEGPERKELRALQNFLQQLSADGRTKAPRANSQDESVRSLIAAHFPGAKAKGAANAERPMDWANAAANRLSMSPRTMLTIKQALDEMVLEAQRTWTKERRPLDAGTLRDLTQVAKEMRALMEQAYPKSFPAANRTFSGYASMETAYDRGRDIKLMTQDELAESMSKLTSAEREMFELGVRDSLIDIVKKTPDGANEVRRLFGTPDMRDKLAAVFSDHGRLQEFATRLGLENLMFAPTQRALRNSTTAGNIFAAERYAGATLPTSPGSWLSRLAEAVARPVTKGASERTNRRLAELLTETDIGRAGGEMYEAAESTARRLARSMGATGGAASNGARHREDQETRNRRLMAAGA